MSQFKEMSQYHSKLYISDQGAKELRQAKADKTVNLADYIKEMTKFKVQQITKTPHAGEVYGTYYFQGNKKTPQQLTFIINERTHIVVQVMRGRVTPGNTDFDSFKAETKLQLDIVPNLAAYKMSDHFKDRALERFGLPSEMLHGWLLSLMPTMERTRELMGDQTEYRSGSIVIYANDHKKTLNTTFNRVTVNEMPLPVIQRMTDVLNEELESELKERTTEVITVLDEIMDSANRVTAAYTVEDTLRLFTAFSAGLGRVKDVTDQTAEEVSGMIAIRQGFINTAADMGQELKDNTVKIPAPNYDETPLEDEEMEKFYSRGDHWRMLPEKISYSKFGQVRYAIEFRHWVSQSAKSGKSVSQIMSHLQSNRIEIPRKTIAEFAGQMLGVDY
jgi:hypothetical protein